MVLSNSMTSELIGELGQVGLRIGEPTSTPVVTTVVECLSGDERKKPRLSTNRSKKFRPVWMMFDIFKDWLRPHPSPEFATCIVCNRVIKAGKSELEKHAVGKRHLRMLKGDSGGSQQMKIEASTGAEAGSVVLLDQEIISSQDLTEQLSYDGSDGNSTGPNTRLVYVAAESRVIDGGATYTSMNCIDASGAGYSGSTNIGSRVRPYSCPPETNTTGTLVYNRVQQQHSVTVASPVVVNQQAGGREPSPLPLYQSRAMVTRPAPPWKATAIVNGHVTKLDLNDYRGRYLILFFYPQDFNRICASEVTALSDRVGEFRAASSEIVACSVDSHLSHLTWSKTGRGEGGVGNPRIPLLADPTHQVARDYGVLLPDRGHTLRATFVIDKRGVLRLMTVYDTTIGRGIDELLRSVKALQHSEETEEPLGADWSPSQPAHNTQ